MNENSTSTSTASFRDPSGFMFRKNGILYRQVNTVYAENYNFLMRSGLYAELTKLCLLIPHTETEDVALADGGYKIIQPELIPFISYPYEWCFSELKDAALCTLTIEKIALKYGMTLKDASAYNIQFREGRPMLIDTLSFERYAEGPWVAYRQFCSHFLAPLALMGYKDIRLGQLLRIYIDGIPLDLASKLLPRRSWLNPALFFHIHMHAKSERQYSDKKVDVRSGKFNRAALDGLVLSLRSGVRSFHWEPEGTEWGDYFGNTNYSDKAIDEKRDAVKRFAESVKPKSAWDVGANDGFFSRALCDLGVSTVAFDIDPAAVEKNYLAVKNKKEKNMLPLVMDLTNPSSALGWRNAERESLLQRGPVDVALALALIHHLVISNTVPFGMAAEFFSRICTSLIIEFIPKEDSQVQRLLKNRGDIFDNYTKENFEKEFERYFVVSDSYAIPASKRILYVMRKK